MTRLRPLAAVLALAALSACEKNAVQDITSPVSGAFVRFHNYSVGAPAVNFYANDQKVTAVLSSTGSESTSGVSYGATAVGGNYAMLAPGSYDLNGRITATTDNGRKVASITSTLADGKFYSYFMSGIYNSTTKTADGFLIEDALPTSFDYSKAYIRVVNASSNAGNISATTQLQGSTEVVTVGTGVAYKGASPIVTIAPGLTDITITVGTTTVRATGVSLSGGHVWTLSVRGDATATTGTNVLTIQVAPNR